VFLGLILSLASALGTNLGFLLKHRGAVAAPDIRASHPVSSAVGLFRSRWFMIGWLVALVAWLLHIGALALAPLSVVQAVLSGGIVFLAVLAERFFGFGLERRQWAGVLITAVGLVVIGLTAKSEGAQHSSLAALIAVESGILAAGAVLVRISAHSAVAQRAEALLLATAAGVLFGVSDVAIKYLTHSHAPLMGLLSPWTLTALISFVISFYASARSLQLGLPVEVIAITSVAANVAAIVGGVLVFGESIGSGAAGIVIRVIAFGLVIAGAALMPAPLRAADGAAPAVSGTAKA
jgi:drug/metabolite transporter (DMT)-like permease